MISGQPLVSALQRHQLAGVGLPAVRRAAAGGGGQGQAEPAAAGRCYVRLHQAPGAAAVGRACAPQALCEAAIMHAAVLCRVFLVQQCISPLQLVYYTSSSSYPPCHCQTILASHLCNVDARVFKNHSIKQSMQDTA